MNIQKQGDQKQNSSSVDDLTKLKELVDAGVLTEEEFTAKKKQILGI
ncbi:SHOCT domain-containing protein [Fructobacillus tropaeoli]